MQRDSDAGRAARQILELARRTLSQSIPAMMPAFYALRERAVEHPGPLATDTIHLFYCPKQVVADFRADRRAVARQLLHLTLHCLLGHPAQRRNARNPERFDLAVDLKVHSLCLQLAERAYGFLRMESGSVDPDQPLPQLYRRLLSARSVGEWKAYRLDDHSLWNPVVVEASSAAGPGAGQDGGGASPFGGRPGAETWDHLRQALLAGSPGGGFGCLPGCLTAELLPARENGISYESFLRRFLSIRERMLTDPDELDFRWYTLGLELYGDIPLLEPPELSELPRADDLVIAMDTSGSCSGDVCRRFLRETRNLLQSIAARNAAFRVLLLQCDTRIQQEVLVNSAEELAGAMERFVPRGFGGTDFRPVFQRVEELRREGVLTRVRGLLYLSDGWGEFPGQAPDYPAAFLLPRSGSYLELPDDFPGWATRVILDPNDFTIQEASQ